MSTNPRRLYDKSFPGFIRDGRDAVFGALCDNYHGVANTNTREAWMDEISIMREVLSKCGEKDGHIIFEYDIPRLGKRIDVVLLLKGIILNRPSPEEK